MLLAGTAIALKPVSAEGRDVVLVQVALFTSNVTLGTRARVTPLLVPSGVLTVTVTFPGALNGFPALPDGTTAMMLLFDHPETLGLKAATSVPCVKTTSPGPLRKLSPLISMARPTGLEGVVELLILDMDGGGGGGPLLLQPPQVMRATDTITMESKDNVPVQLTSLMLVP